MQGASQQNDNAVNIFRTLLGVACIASPLICFWWAKEYIAMPPIGNNGMGLLPIILYVLPVTLGISAGVFGLIMALASAAKVSTASAVLIALAITFICFLALMKGAGHSSERKYSVEHSPLHLTFDTSRNEVT